MFLSQAVYYAQRFSCYFTREGLDGKILPQDGEQGCVLIRADGKRKKWNPTANDLRRDDWKWIVS